MTERAVAAGLLLSFAAAEFGEHLSGLLLSGYGESPRRQVRTYDVNLREGVSDERLVRVKLLGDAPFSFPGGDEPLVLLALLKLIWADVTSRAGLDFKHETLLRTLGWEDAKDIRRLTDRAVERYYFLSLEKEVAEEVGPHAGQFYRVMTQRIIVDYSYYLESGEDVEEGERIDSRVAFNPDFIQGLKDRTLLGIDWGKAQSVTRLD